MEICVKERGGRTAPLVGSVPVAEMLAAVTREDHPETAPRPPKSQNKPTIEKVSFFDQKCWFFIGKVCNWSPQGRFTLRFNAKNGDVEKKYMFDLEICVKARGGRTALQPEALLSLKC